MLLEKNVTFDIVQFSLFILHFGYNVVFADIHYWIGLSDQQVEGQFIWESTSELARFTNWVPGDPNDAHGNEDCVLTNWHTKWADANCNWKEHFVCQGRI